MAASSVTELVQAVKRLRSLSESSDGSMRRRSEGGDKDWLDAAAGRRNSDNKASTRSSMEKINEMPEKWNKKLTRRSFMGMLRKSRSSFTTFDNRETSDDDRESDDDDGPGRVDDIIRQKEMRKGIDLATMLERIEKKDSPLGEQEEFDFYLE